MSYGNRVVYVHREKYISIFNVRLYIEGILEGVLLRVLRFPPVSSNHIFMEATDEKEKEKVYYLIFKMDLS